MTRSYSLLLALAFIASALAVSLIRGRTAMTETPPSAVRTDQAEIDAPIADFNPAQEADSVQRAKRLLKNRRHNLRDKNITADNRAQFVLREDKPSQRERAVRPEFKPSVGRPTINHEYNPPVIGGAVTDESPSECPLPTYNSDVVVLGYVTEASAYLSEDKTSVYSEFQLQISQVFKSPASAFDPTATIAVLRPGGGVRFPSGAVRYFLVAGRGLPRAGKRYLLFLKYDDLAQSFYIVTGYELREGKVFPLDSIPAGGTPGHPFASYLKYNGAPESDFIADLRDAILHPTVPQQSGFPISRTTPKPEDRR